MTTDESVSRGIRYVVTDAGRDALQNGEFCPCEIRLLGVLLQCTMCGTVYGHLRDQTLPFPRRNGRARRH